LNNLDCLVDGGTCIAIGPMQKALATSGSVYEYKKKLLDKHTLEAVLSMPDELFFNSKVNVVTCVMIITAHKKHPLNKKTYLGYYKDDGFIKRKIQGRFDGFGKWAETKQRWITSFINREDEAGFSINEIVTAKDEWCAEAYMETDYSSLTEKDFEDTVFQYVAFLFSNRLADFVVKSSLIDFAYIIDNTKWVEYSFSTLFHITGTKTTPLNVLNEYGAGIYPYITTQATNNGTEGFYDYFTENGNVLTVDSAVLGYCSYQPLNFSASDHVEKLIPKFHMNKYIAMFLVTIINIEQYRYNYGRKCSQTRLKSRKIKLPAKNGIPDWEFMENYIKSVSYSGSI
jgi:hypothetical protein